MPKTLTENEWKVLLTKIQAKRCTPFLGPEVSCSVLPAETEIARDWAAQCGYPLPEGTDLAHVAMFLAAEYGDFTYPKMRLRQALEKLGPPDFHDLNEPHRVLADLPLTVYVTTNFDDFMAQCLESPILGSGQRDPKRAFCRWDPSLTEETMIFDDKPNFIPDVANPVVYHMHGRLSYPESLVLTIDDYLKFLVNVSRDQKLLPPQVQKAFGGNTLLFLGYRLSDWSFLTLLGTLKTYIDHNVGKVAHLSVQLVQGHDAMPIDKKEQAQEILGKYFGNLNISIYWGTCQQFSTELRKRWEAFNQVSRDSNTTAKMAGSTV